MMFQIFLDHFFCQCTRCDTKISTGPKMLAPISFFHMWELREYLPRHPVFDPTHNVRGRNIRRSGNQNMHMIFADHTTQYVNLKTNTCLPNKLPHPESKVPLQKVITIFSYPHKMILYLVFCMASLTIFHAKNYNPTASKMLFA